MSTKKRIHDLAKEIGMSGTELVKKLRERNVTEKSAMAGLEDFEYLQIRGFLEANGMIKAAASPTVTIEQSGALVVKKKKKKRKSVEQTDDEPAEPVSEDEEETTPTEQPEPTAARNVETPAHAAASATATPETEEPVAPRRAKPEPEKISAESPAPTNVASSAKSAPAPEPEVEDEDEVQVESDDSDDTEAAEDETRIVEVVPNRPAASDTAAPEAPAPKAAPKSPKAPEAPKTPRRKGTVIGFVDLSKIKSTAPKKTESRRLRSRDDVAPDVKPTLGHDKKRALVRGDRGPRGQLTAGELREREAGRFLRRSGPGARGGPGPGMGTRGPRRDDGSGSPHAGTTVAIDAPATIKKLADKLSIKSGDLLKVAGRQLGFGAVNINSLLDPETAILLASEFDVELNIVQQVEAEQALISDLKKKRTGVEDEALEQRPPTVAFLGHVDHGKTTLIDSIRNSRVAEGEAGGITQHIGAYQVKTKKGHTLTIVDTPGHAAFTAMRARGANAVDIVVLVVAADDGPMQSTEEALAHARAAGVPVVVALTKIDKPEAKAQEAMGGLSRLGLIPEEWGGDTAMIQVSALKGTGVEDLLERVFLESEVLELKCHPAGPAQGVVLEAEISEGKGIVAHLLIQDGTLKRGDVILAGEGYGKVRSMHDDRGKIVTEAPPSLPVEVSGLSALPGVGETFYVVGDLAQAKKVAEERERKNRALTLTERRTVTAESLMSAVADQNRLAINLVVRADVQGSVEVLKSTLGELKHEEVEVKVLFAGVGTVTENDVNLASTSNAMIIAFNVGVNDKARSAAERLNVDIRDYEVIYQLIDHLRDLMEGTLAPEMAEEITGHVEVRALFKSSKIGTIAGCHVTDGSVFRDSKVRVTRGDEVIYTGAILSLKREKDDAKEVRSGFDCGITLRDFQDLQPQDVIEAYKLIKVKRTLGG
ncbi:MAG: translation initiation factor IF-2 [Planctomycetes bacterium]|nr:translation initiation factor IF-2 [Planctomycetota bacterium]